MILSFVGTIKITLEFIKVRLDILATNSQLEFGNIATEYGAINNVQLTGVWIALPVNFYYVYIFNLNLFRSLA